MSEGRRPNEERLAARGTQMAMILEFRSDMSRAGARDCGAAQGAQIIIFPGVRIERHAEAPKPARRDRNRTKRDRLELPD